MSETSAPPAAILIVDADILVRHVIADYLRGCGYTVLEATNGREAQIILEVEAERVEVVLADADATGERDGFGLARWLREAYPAIDVVLAGSPAMAAAHATDLCEDGPAVDKPYQPQQVMDRIKWLMAQRARRT
ncbi:response regulator [Xanthobacter dioxanivorans]|uniref:Response regulator n=1 Tax=Xanthobacter dioxanivorans TaxID=2528964 RepID=A0A974PPS1_9HYPH|nr:response regulator [Xanthobacter dioxanivorans]QRG07502.1 response regulator [Xanthobacter dioxanivorans]